MSERVVPVAYVTRWATTVGIRVIRGAEETASGALYRNNSFYVIRNEWTEDKSEAEARYRAKIDAARHSAERKAKKLEALYKAPPKYTEG